MFVKKGENLFRQLDKFGSCGKASVVRPVEGNMPDLAFEAPTCKTGIQVFFRHGKVGSFILQLRLVFQLVALTIRMLLSMDNDKNIAQISKPRSKYLKLSQFFKIQLQPDECNEVDQIDLKYFVSYPAT